MIKIMLIGKPNVGKSSLFNRFARRNIAITSDVSGTTRDTNRIKINISGNEVIIVDSGGLDEDTELFKNIKKRTLEEAKDADILLYLVDGKMYPSDDDRAFFYEILRLGKKSALVVNKVDNKKDLQRAYEFDSFGCKDVFFISATHNSGIDELLDYISSYLPKHELEQDNDMSLEDFLDDEEEIIQEYEDEEKEYVAYSEDAFKKIDENHIRVGIVGRVNVGKSSLLNSLVKQNRSVVSDVAGTTIDPVNESVEYNGKVIEFVDTAGIRRRGKIEGIERYALNRTEKMLENADIALLVLDSSEDFNELDEKISGLIAKHCLGVIIVLNKWDLKQKDDKEFDKLCKSIRLDLFKHIAHAPIISVSALTHKRVDNIYKLIFEVYENYIQKIPTSKLNALIEEATKAHPLPHDKGKLVKIYYAAQYDIAPPKIALVMNRPKALHFSYKRYLANKLRSEFNFSGVPLLINSRSKNQREKQEEKF